MLTVLVADDQPPILELVRYTLEGDRIRVIEAADGEPPWSPPGPSART